MVVGNILAVVAAFGRRGNRAVVGAVAWACRREAIVAWLAELEASFVFEYRMASGGSTTIVIEAARRKGAVGWALTQPGVGVEVLTPRGAEVVVVVVLAQLRCWPNVAA